MAAGRFEVRKPASHISHIWTVGHPVVWDCPRLTKRASLLKMPLITAIDSERSTD